MKVEKMVCPNCGSGAVLSDRSVLKANNTNGSEKVYLCELYPECDSYVGCKPGTDEPLGTLADAQLRKLRMEAHRVFDWIWKSGRMSRSRAYEALRKVMDLSEEDAHIGKFNAEQCRDVIEIFGGYKSLSVPCDYSHE